MNCTQIIFLLVILGSACKCPPAADIIEITSLHLEGDKQIDLHTQNTYALFVSPAFVMKEGEESKCLSYTKEKPVTRLQNPLHRESLILKCNKKIQNIEAGENLLADRLTEISQAINTDKRDNINAITIETQFLDTGIYRFNLQGISVQGRLMKDSLELRVGP